MALFPPPPPLPDGDAPHPVERLLAGGAGATALALGVGRMLRVVERREARADTHRGPDLRTRAVALTHCALP
jgi:hypothetical protein